MKLLIANRGEIAARVARTAILDGWQVQLVHPSDEIGREGSYRLNQAGPAAFLDREGLVAAALHTASTHIHPGYGFLSEDPEFSRMCTDAGLTFVGPDTATLSLFGDKSRTRELAKRVGVPVLPATGPDASEVDLVELLARYPEGIMIKSTHGGGGRGMRIIRSVDEIGSLWQSARAESERSCGDPAVHGERLLEHAKHIEVQIVSDGTRNAVILGDRECSVQRRNQKLIECAPSPSLDGELRNKLGDFAKRLIEATSLKGLATVEFLLPTDSQHTPVLLEVNPRLQVEHTVTEAITGLDLVALQLQIANGATLTDLNLADVPHPDSKQFAIQVRLNAEERSGGAWSAGTGTINAIEWPTNARVDTDLRIGDQITGRWDPLIAKIMTHTNGDWAEACFEAHTALEKSHIEGVPTNKELLLQLLEDPVLTENRVTTDWVDRLTGGVSGTQTSGSDVVSPVVGTVVRIEHDTGVPVGAGQALIVVEAMKMEHPITAGQSGFVTQWLVEVGDQVEAGTPLAVFEASDTGDATAKAKPEFDVGSIRPELAELHERKALTLDAARPEAVAKRHARGRLTVRESLAQLFDEDSFVEYGSFPVAAQRTRRSLDDLIANTPADGIVTGIGRIAGRSVAVLAYDWTVLAGTQGYFNHHKTDRMLEIAREQGIPVVLFAEGGGGRPGDTDAENLVVAGLNLETFARMGALSGKVPTVGILSGKSFAGNAALLGICDVIIATEGSNLGMAGPAMIEGGGLGSFRPEEIGPMDVQSANGVIDVLVADDTAAAETARKYLGYFAGTRAEWTAADQRLLRHGLGENRKTVYDARSLIETLADEDSVLELRAGFGTGILTALIRIEGKPYALIANNPSHLGGAIDADGADKMARFLQLADAHGLPVVTLCDTPGFMVGPDSETQAAVRHFSRLFTIGANLRIPLLTVILRKAYGLGAMAMAGGGFTMPQATIAWPTGEIGAMGLEGAVRLGYAKELAAITDPAAQKARYEELLAGHLEEGKALNAAMKREFDEVIDPADSRRWITAILGDWEPDGPSGRYIDTW